MAFSLYFSLIWLHHTAKIVFTIMLKVNGSFNTSIFSQGVNSFMSFNWLKEQRIFNQNVFLVHAQTLLEVNKIFVQFHRLSSDDIKTTCIEMTGSMLNS